MVYPVAKAPIVRQYYEWMEQPYQPGVWTLFRTYLYVRSLHYVQSPPHQPTPVLTDIYRRESGATGGDSWAVTPDEVHSATTAMNNARAKFISELGSASQFGSTLTTELRRSWGTVAGGITNLYMAARSVKKGRLGEAARILGVSPPAETVRIVKSRRKLRNGRYVKKYVKRKTLTLPSGRVVAHNAANRWLWYSYGIKPLVSDIHNATQVLVREPPWRQVRASSGASSQTSYMTDSYTFTHGVTIIANVRVKNPNLWLANQLGLINPVQMFNEGIPFSFVIDWFSNLTPFIMQLTDFVGLEIADPVTISKHKVVMTYIHPTHPGFNWAKSWTRHKRVLHIPPVRFQLAYERFQWQRGANAISLLVRFLEKR